MVCQVSVCEELKARCLMGWMAVGRNGIWSRAAVVAALGGGRACRREARGLGAAHHHLTTCAGNWGRSGSTIPPRAHARRRLET